jgi:hypothetical protein
VVKQPAHRLKQHAASLVARARRYLLPLSLKPRPKRAQTSGNNSHSIIVMMAFA